LIYDKLKDLAQLAVHANDQLVVQEQLDLLKQENRRVAEVQIVEIKFRAELEIQENVLAFAARGLARSSGQLFKGNVIAAQRDIEIQNIRDRAKFVDDYICLEQRKFTARTGDAASKV
jgi:hypothetical protein